MSDGARGAIVGAVLTVVVGAVVVAGVAVAVASSQASQPRLRASRDGWMDVGGHRLAHYTLSLATFPDSLFGSVHGSGGGSHPDWVSYSNDNLSVPSHSVLTVTVRQYDTGGTPNNAFFARVVGTLGGTETVNGTVVRQVNPDNLGHTFTLRGIPGNGSSIWLNAPLPGVSASAPNTIRMGDGEYPRPNVISFSFVTPSKGVYYWNCEYPCGTSLRGFGGAMSTLGYMSGTLTVS